MTANVRRFAMIAAVLACIACSGTGSNSDTTAESRDVPPQLPEGAPKVDDDRIKGPAVCSLTPSTNTEGTFVEGPETAELSSDGSGLPLTIQAKVVDVDGCTPIADARVDVWHRDPAAASWIRGHQATSSLGVATFTSAYPGWADVAPRVYVRVSRSGAVVFEGQFFFPEVVSSNVGDSDPYNSNPVPSNDADPIFTNSTMSDRLLLGVTPMGRAAYLASLTIGIDG